MASGSIAQDNNYQIVQGAVSSVSDTGSSTRSLQYNPTTRGLTVHIVGNTPPDIDVTTNPNYIKKHYTSTGAVTDGIIWSPATGKRWHVVSLKVVTSVAATITLEDDLAAVDSVLDKGEYAANSGFAMYYGDKYPLASGEDAADLLI